MYSLNDITNGCVKQEMPENNGTCEMPIVKVEISEAPCNTVGHQTISLTQESIYEVPSLGEISTQEDVLNIQISNVQGAASDHKANKDELMTVNQRIVNHVDKPSNQEMQSRFEVGTQEKVPLTERLPGGQLSKHMITQEKRHPVETDVRSPVNQSEILNGEPLTETAKQKKELPFQLNSHERVPSYHLNHQPEISQMSNQYPAYQTNTNGTIPAYQVDTQGSLSAYQNGVSESVSSHQISTNMAPPSVYTSSHATVPLHHMADTPTSQSGNGEKNTNYQATYHPGMSTYYGDYSFHDYQQGMPFWQTEAHHMTPTHPERSAAHSCNCCCHGQNDTSHHPAFGTKNQRPSVIMVPVSWSSSDSGTSHLPLKVDTTSYKLHSQNQEGHWPNREGMTDHMDYSDDSDSSDDDDEYGKQEKYFRKNIDGTTARFKLTKEDWSRIPINTFPSGGRLLSGDWTRIFLSKVKESNPWCSLRFKNNHVRSENSRKIHSAVFFRGGAECKRPECNVKVRFVIRKEKGKHVDVTYVGNICHNSQPGGSDVTNDKKRMKRVRRTYST